MSYPEGAMPDDPARETPPDPSGSAAQPKVEQAPASPPPAAGDGAQAAAPGDGQTAEPSLSDDQIIQALGDPRAQTILEYAVGQQAGGRQPQERPAGSGVEVAPSAAPRTTGNILGDLAKLAEEGDLEGIQGTVARAQAAAAQGAATAETERTVRDTTRRQLLAGVAEADELKDLTATEQLRLANALNKGDVTFIAEASKIIGERQAAQQGAAQDQGQANRALANVQVAAGQARAGATPDVPAATPAGAPPVPEGEDAKSKSGYDVLSEYFSWEEQQEQGTPPG